jgi:FMN phosphatase YigB (HAD superfamily)
MPPPGDAEAEFRKWYADRASRTGISSDPDEPEHFYDYRAAHRDGAEPEISSEDGQYHWPSKYKADNHPNRYVMIDDTLTDTKHERPVDPHVVAALKWLQKRLP